MSTVSSMSALGAKTQDKEVWTGKKFAINLRRLISGYEFYHSQYQEPPSNTQNLKGNDDRFTIRITFNSKTSKTGMPTSLCSHVNIQIDES